jgi:hypothetical protein
MASGAETCSFFVLSVLVKIMHDRRDSDNELARDIGFAIWHSPFRLKKGQSIDTCVLLGRAVVDHLRRCLWRFERLPPREMHGSFRPKVKGQGDRR